MPDTKRSDFVEKFNLGSLSGVLSGSASSGEPVRAIPGDLLFALLRWLKGQPAREGQLVAARAELKVSLPDLQMASESLSAQDLVQVLDRPVDGNWKVRAS